MLAKKIRTGWIVLGVALIAGLFGGCTPPASRALREGRRLVEAGQYEQAIEALQRATRLAATNDAAWNYLGVAYHGAGQFTNAAAAYQQAIRLNRDLIEARFNLGCLWLDLKKFDLARDAFTSCTTMRPGFTEAWVQRGTAELRLREFAAAETSFREVLKSAPRHAEALNGLGLTQWQRNRPREAAQQFDLALKAQPDFAPALLNLATVTYQQLNDRKTALQYYNQYLALNPRPAEFEAVQKLVQSFEPAAAKPSPTRTNPTTAVVTAASQPTTPPAKSITAPTPRTVTAPVVSTPVASTAPPTPAPAASTAVVTLPPEPAIRAAGESGDKQAPAASIAPEKTSSTPPDSASAASHKSFFARINPMNLFRSDSNSATKTTPLTAASSPGNATTKSSGGNPDPPSALKQVSGNSSVTVEERAWSRYNYSAPEKFVSGDRTAAGRALSRGQALLQSNRVREARPYLDQAVNTDPSWFEARFAQGLAAMQARDYRTALFAWERALMIDPQSRDARYNFALTLKAANYPLDAARQLEQLLAEDANDVRSHLALGNLFAETLRDPARARVHYAKVIELNPQHPQSTEIRYWLLANEN